MGTRTVILTLSDDLVDAVPGVLHRTALLLNGEDAAVLRLLSDAVERAAAGGESVVEAIAVNSRTAGEA